MRLRTPAERTDERQQGLIRGRGGATMVMGVFMAAFLVGMIYYVWGIGDAVLHRERMQDAADTAAFGAAVIHARGMNMLALLNMIMAALAMVSATLAVISNMIMYAATAATLVCSFCGPHCGSCCEACPPAAQHWAEFAMADEINNLVRDIVDGAIEGFNGYAAGIRAGVPVAARTKVRTYGTSVYEPVTERGFLAPVRAALPAEDDDSDWPCDEKVLPTVRAASTANVWSFASPSIYMAGGIGLGLLTARSEAREFCHGASFQRVVGSAEEMGTEDYQVQAYMRGRRDLDWTAEGVAIATWGEDDGVGAEYRELAELSRLGFAQAEFFYDDREDDWREWLWHMNWRARLRRWRSSVLGGGALGEVCDACGSLGGLEDAGGSLDDLVVH